MPVTRPIVTNDALNPASSVELQAAINTICGYIDAANAANAEAVSDINQVTADLVAVADQLRSELRHLRRQGA